MNSVLRDIAIGRRLARNGLSVSRSTRAPYPYERLARYRAVSAAISADAYCTIQSARPVPTPTRRAKRRGGKA